VRDDPEQPWAKLGAPAEASERAMRSQEALLGGLACLIATPDPQVRSPIRDLLVQAHKLLEGRRVTAPGRFDPFALEQWTALHLCHSYTAVRRAVPPDP